MAEQTQVNQGSGRAAPTMTDLVDRLSRFDGPPEAFLSNLLAVQCYIAAASGGAILRMATQGGQVEALAIHPPIPQGGRAPLWLAQAVEHGPGVLNSGGTSIKPVQAPDDLYGAPPRMFLVLVPIRGATSVRGVAGYLIETADQSALAICRERLELTVSLLSLYEMRLTLQRRQLDMSRMRLAMDVLGAVNDHDRFAGAGMAFCNELASRLQCDRVGLGFLKGKYVHLKALSHTEKFTRKMKLVQDVESAMEECLDQDVEVIYPSTPESTYVSRSTKELATRQSPMAVLSLPLRRAGEVVGTATLERPVEKPFSPEEIESLRLTCDLCTPRLNNLHQHDRWFGARAAGAIRKGAALAVGSKHTWAKLLVLGLLGLVLFTIFAFGPKDAEGTFAFEATVQQALVSPFPGKLESVSVKPNQEVKKGQVLAVMDTKELLDELAKANGDLESSRTSAEKARGEGKTVEVQYHQSQARKYASQIALIQKKIEAATITSPIDGKVISNKDWTREYRPYLETGDPIFEVAPLMQIRAVIDVPEEDIADVKVGHEGELAAMGYPDRKIPFKVERIPPMAEQSGQSNVFKVVVTLDEAEVRKCNAQKDCTWLAPGATGTAHIHLGQERYCNLWTKKLINWVRMKLWI